MKPKKSAEVCRLYDNMGNFVKLVWKGMCESKNAVYVVFFKSNVLFSIKIVDFQVWVKVNWILGIAIHTFTFYISTFSATQLNGFQKFESVIGLF